MSKDGIVYKHIWDTFRTVEFAPDDISAIESKPDRDGVVTKLPYLKWSVALRILTENFPDHKIEFERFDRGGKVYDVMYYPSEAASVHCTITIEGVSRDMWLAVTDYRHNSLTNPDATDISNSKMRCMVKCLALFGLGIEIYEGKYVEPERVDDENQASQ
jgi:hypothetical protein